MKFFQSKKLNFFRITSKNRGVTLFMAVTIMAVLLFVSFVVINIAIKSSLFASSGKDSQYAFYAADAGIECAMYWDRQSVSKFDITVPGSPISCGGISINSGNQIQGTTTGVVNVIGGNASTRSSIFGFNLNNGNNPSNACVIVNVTKNVDGTTYIKSRGYNTCDTSNSRRVERGVEVLY